nr:MAG TPA: hypothetical protein [Bacteriophage sp.]
MSFTEPPYNKCKIFIRLSCFLKLYFTFIIKSYVFLYCKCFLRYYLVM